MYFKPLVLLFSAIGRPHLSSHNPAANTVQTLSELTAASSQLNRLADSVSTVNFASIGPQVAQGFNSLSSSLTSEIQVTTPSELELKHKNKRDDVEKKDLGSILTGNIAGVISLLTSLLQNLPLTNLGNLGGGLSPTVTGLLQNLLAVVQGILGKVTTTKREPASAIDMEALQNLARDIEQSLTLEAALPVEKRDLGSILTGNLAGVISLLTTLLQNLPSTNLGNLGGGLTPTLTGLLNNLVSVITNLLKLNGVTARQLDNSAVGDSLQSIARDIESAIAFEAAHPDEKRDLGSILIGNIAGVVSLLTSLLQNLPLTNLGNLGPGLTPTVIGLLQNLVAVLTNLLKVNVKTRQLDNSAAAKSLESVRRDIEEALAANPDKRDLGSILTGNLAGVISLLTSLLQNLPLTNLGNLGGGLSPTVTGLLQNLLAVVQGILGKVTTAKRQIDAVGIAKRELTPSAKFVKRSLVPAPYIASEQHQICDAFHEFVTVHEGLLTTIIKKKNLMPGQSVEAIEASLRQIGQKVDGLALGLVGSVDVCAAEVIDDLKSMEHMIEYAVKAYA